MSWSLKVCSEYLSLFLPTRMLRRVWSIQKFLRRGWLTVSPTEPALLSKERRPSLEAKLVVATGTGTMPPGVIPKIVLVVKKSGSLVLANVAGLVPYVSVIGLSVPSV